MGLSTTAALALGAAGGAVGGTLLSSAMSPKPKIPTPPPPPAPMPAPTENDPALAAAKKKEIAAQVQRSGRLSTILSQTGNAGTSDKLGG